MGSYFLTKSVVAPGTLVQVAGAPVLERHDALIQALSPRVGPAALAIFAEPVMSRGNDTAAATVSWYATRAGTGQRLADLDPGARAAAETVLRQRLVEVAGALDDPQFGPLLGGALQILAPEDIWVVEGEPVLVNWGMVPAAALGSATERTLHFRRTLGPYLPLDEAPAISAQDWRARTGIRPAPVETPPPPPPPPPPLAPVAPMAPPPPVVVPVAAGPSRWVWVPLLLVLGVEIAALVWLLMPGTRLFPPAPAPVLIEDAAVAQALDTANAALEQRAQSLREAIAGAVCTAEGDLLIPGGRTPEGLLPGAPVPPGTAVPGAADALLPPDPGRVQVPRAPDAPATAPDPGSLLNVIEQRTVLVLAQGGDEGGTGSGFFVGPDLVVTNHHVVLPALGGGKLYVTNRALGGVREAEVVKTLGPLEETGGDYALLRVAGASLPFYTLRASVETMKLQNVVAAGYPGAVLETDQRFDQLLAGDPTAIPDITVTMGIVNTEQTFGPATRTLIHTAEISPGNSGGPLVDTCGRVVGVNTFGRTSDERHLNFSLSAADLIAFLQGAGVGVTSDAGPCVPQLSPAAPPPRGTEAPAPTPDPATPAAPAAPGAPAAPAAP